MTQMPRTVDDVNRLELAKIIDEVESDIEDERGTYKDDIAELLSELNQTLEEDKGDNPRTVDGVNVMALRRILNIMLDKLMTNPYEGEHKEMLNNAVHNLRVSLSPENQQ